jgi:ribosomal protein L11 methylase PrmA
VRESIEARGLAWPPGDDEAQLRQALIALLDRDVEHCPHGLALGVDLAIAEPFEAIDGLRIAGAPGLGVTFGLLAGPAMGSGARPWTRALLLAIERHLPRDAVVADVGTGTGILALWAIARGARRVDAVDVDPLAAAVARRNARVNQAADRIAVQIGSAEALDGNYDVAIVSLGGVAELPAVMAATVARLRAGGVLIASPAEGPSERAQLGRALAELGLAEIDAIVVEDWTVAVARR